MSTPLGNNTPPYKNPNTPLFLIRLSNHRYPLDSLYMPTHHPYCMYPWHRLPDTTTLHPPNHSNRHQHCCTTLHYCLQIYMYQPNMLYMTNHSNDTPPHIHRPMYRSTLSHHWYWCLHATMYMHCDCYYPYNNIQIHTLHTTIQTDSIPPNMNKTMNHTYNYHNWTYLNRPMMMSIPPNWSNDSMYVILNVYVYHRLLFRCPNHCQYTTQTYMIHTTNQIYSNSHYTPMDSCFPPHTLSMVSNNWYNTN